jgi:hypothetical protein
VASDKNFFEQLNTKTIGDNAASTIQALSNPVHIQSSNKEVLDAIIQVNRAGMRDGLPIPKTGSVEQVLDNDSGAWFEICRPSAGEVYQVGQIGIGSITGRSGNLTLYIRISDEVNGTSVIIDNTTVASDGDQHLPDLDTPVILDENLSLGVYISGTFTSVLVKAAKVRVR